MEDPEICQPQRKLPPRTRPVAEHQTVGRPESGKSNDWHTLNAVHRFYLQHLGNTWNSDSLSALHLPVPGAVHGLECKDVIFHGEGEHVFAVVLPVARCLPQFAVIDVGGGYFLKASSPVFILEKQQNHTHNKLKPASWTAQVLYWAELNHDFWHESQATAMEIRSCGFYLSICFP